MDIRAGSGAAAKLGVDSEEVRDDVFAHIAIVNVRGEDDVMHEGTDPIVDTEAHFVPSVEREEDGVVWEVLDAVGQGRADKSRFKGVGVGDVVVEQFGTVLVQELMVWRPWRQAVCEELKVKFVA